MNLSRKSFDKRFLVSFSLVFAIAFFLRFFRLSEVPFGFHRDELINAYVGRFILLNGKDLYGNSWPLFYFNKFGDFPPILPMYIMGLSTFLFGVHEFAARFPSAFVGTLTLIPVYFLSYLLYKRKSIALLSAFFIAILPWHIVLSRMSGEGILAVFVFSFGLLSVLQGVLHGKQKYVYLAYPLFLLTYFLYPSFRILSPLAVVPLFFLGQKTKAYVAGLIIILLLTTAAISSTVWGRARFNQTSIFNSVDVSNTIQYLTNDEGHADALSARLFHNKPVGYSREFLRQYFSYFSPNFLFMNGGPPYEYMIPDVGLLYVAFFILVLGFLLPVQTGIQKNVYYYFLYLLLIAPIPASLTIDFPPHVHRSLIMVIPIVLLLPTGLLKILEITKRKKLVLAVFFFVLGLEFIYFSHQYFVHISSYKSIFKNDGAREAAQYVIAHHNQYSKVYMFSSNLPLYYLFYSNDFSRKYIGEFNMKNGFLEISSIDNISFVNTECPSEMFKNTFPTNRVLVIDSGNCSEGKVFSQIETLKAKDGLSAFKILEYNPNK